MADSMERVHCKSVMRWLASATLTLAVLTGASALAQTPSLAKATEQLRTEIARQFGAEEQLDAALMKAYGVELTEEKAEVSRRALRTLIFNDATPDYIAKLLMPVYRPQLSQQEVVAVVMEGILELQVRGLQRLAPSRQALLVSHIVDMARALPPSTCKALFLGQIATKEAADLERRFIASLPLSRFEGIVTVYREATEAELAGYPDERSINAQQAKLAQKVYDEAIGKRVRAQSSKEAIARVKADIASAPAGEVCSVMSSSVQAMLDMPEPYKSWQLTRFVQSMQ
jgi:hypothetical protein